LKQDFVHAAWRKSTRSNNGGQCVEVASAGDSIGLRDSKRPHEAVLILSKDSWSAFVAGVRDGEFDHA
jgi:hypothetical protein